MPSVDGSNIKTLKNPKYLKIVYADPLNDADDLVVYYKLRNHDFVPSWIERLDTAQEKNYQIDDPCRFYGFNDIETETDYTVKSINRCINTINSFAPIINRTIKVPIDIDTLNYLHHIFEVYHGLLDKPHEFFIQAPTTVKKALSDLNLLVHRGENLIRGTKPRHVVTYFGLEKTKKIQLQHLELLTDKFTFGTVYLNYVEIGKTLEDLAVDEDQYISDDAFQPYQHYSADFAIKFYDTSDDWIKEKRSKMLNFYNNNIDFFQSRNLKFDDHRLKPGKIPLADIDSHGQEVLQLLKSRQFVKSVKLI